MLLTSLSNATDVGGWGESDVGAVDGVCDQGDEADGEGGMRGDGEEWKEAGATC